MILSAYLFDKYLGKDKLEFYVIILGFAIIALHDCSDSSFELVLVSLKDLIIRDSASY